MDLRDLKRIANKTIVSAGARYTPGAEAGAPNLHVDDLSAAISGLCAGAEVSGVLDEKLKELVESWGKIKGASEKAFKRTKSNPDLVIKLVKSLADHEPGKTIPILAQAHKAIKVCERKITKLEASAVADIEAHKRVSSERGEADSSSYTPDNTLVVLENKTREFQSFLYELRQIDNFLKSRVCRLLNDNIAFLLGDWGTGKTHFLCDVAKKRIDAKKPALVVLAKDFIATSNPGTSLCKFTGLASSLDGLLKGLSDLAKKTGERALLLIDGINEADREQWKRYLRELIRAVRKYQNVGLVLSCRQPFDELMIPPILRRQVINLYHRGFEGQELDAQTEFFRFYNLPLPEVPLLADEFSRPLTLKLLCQGFSGLSTAQKKRGITGIASGQKSMTTVLEQFIKKVGKEVEDELGLSRMFCWWLLKGARQVSDSAFDGIAPLMARNLRDYITEDECIKVITSHHTVKTKAVARRILRHLIVSGLLTETVQWRSEEEGGSYPVVRLPYERFGDHLIARHLLDEIRGCKNVAEIRRAFYSNKPLGHIFTNQKYMRDEYQLPGWAEALIVEFPEAVKRKLPENERELYFYLPKNRRSRSEYFRPFIGGLFWRSPSSFSKATIDLINHYLHRHNNYVGRQTLDVIFGIASKPKHPLSAHNLFEYLASFSMVERDLYWTEYLREGAEEMSVEKFLRWVEIPDNTQMKKETASNAIILASLLLTTTDRYLRDRSTRALVFIGELHPQQLFEHTERTLAFNDPYVSERMLAASYGVGLSMWAGPDKGGFKKSLKDFAKTLVKQMFVSGAPYATHHSLMKGYALDIISLARKSSPGCIATRYIRYLKPPFSEIPSLFPASSSIQDADVVDGHSAIRMDFGNYTIGRLISDRRNYDDDHEEYASVRRQIEWRIGNLGFKETRFKTVDSNITRYSGHSRQPDGNKTDRYGKKYSWVAYFEMFGLRQAHGLLSDYRAKERVSDCDIDPSFPEAPPSWMPSLPYVFRAARMQPARWLVHGGTPDYSSLLQFPEIQGQDGPWVLLDGFVQQENPNDRREVFSFLRGLFLSRDDVDEFIKRYNDKEYPGNHAIPNSPSNYYAYAGEIPWSEHCCTDLWSRKGIAQPIIEESCSEYVTNYHSIRIKDGWKEFYRLIPDNELDGLLNELSKADSNGGRFREIAAVLGRALESSNSHVTVENRLNLAELGGDRPTNHEAHVGSKQVTTYDRIPGIQVELPSCSYSWESHHSRFNQYSGFATVSPSICQKLSLENRNREIDLFDKHGKRASIFREFRTERAHGNLLYLRKDLLERYLDECKKMLIWPIWGERSFHYEIIEEVRQTNQVQKIWQGHEHIHKAIHRY